LLFRCDNFKSATFFEEGVDLRNNDVANGRFRTPNPPQISDVHLEITGLDFIPGKAFAPGDEVRCVDRRGDEGWLPVHYSKALA
jgi:hypothetical protein